MSGTKDVLLADAPNLQQMVRDRDPTLKYSDAKAALRDLGSQPPPLSGCYKITCSKNDKCCPNKTFGYVCPCSCPCCMWTPMCPIYGFPISAVVGMCLCNSKDSHTPGSYSATDLKGNFTGIVPLDKDGKTVAWFQGNEYVGPNQDEIPVTCWLEK
eukprot:CAMPEP_0182462350 /NCGR_PEP_ID=MMETSP1319-20130603/6647_1 /TAXON_ID=172717 /ORGANISM="Bolidomonas pacifica, Strain RCC208" /LENGTH=155 /DNA_ID=CAMNT_0024661773 /DNA_START=200 /DNA_END=667 /DNA_ORIENTATION=+